MTPHDFLDAFVTTGWTFAGLGFCIGLFIGYLIADFVEVYRYWSDLKRLKSRGEYHE